MSSFLREKLRDALAFPLPSTVSWQDGDWSFSLSYEAEADRYELSAVHLPPGSQEMRSSREYAESVASTLSDGTAQAVSPRSVEAYLATAWYWYRT